MSAGEHGYISVEIALALPERQWLVTWQLPEGATVAQLLNDPSFQQKHPELSAAAQVMEIGVWSQLVSDRAAQVLHEGDRVELYRPLLIDPKEARRARAEKLRKAKQA